MQIEENVPLAPLTTFHIGGSARYFVRARTEQELRDALALSEVEGLRVYIFGGGSNTLVPDAGFDGLVIKIAITGIEILKEHNNKDEDVVPNVETETGGKVLMVAGAGEGWDGLVAHTVEQGLWGLENLSGIPGTVGGAVWGNIGAYGASVSQTLQWVEAYDREAGEMRRFDAAACALGYRDSFFKQHAGRYVIVRAAFALAQTPRPNLSYKDLSARFAVAPSQTDTAPATTVPTLAEIRDAVLAIRKEKFPDLSVEGTAGSFFKNPIVSKADADALLMRYPTMPIFAVPEANGVKIPLAWLLDNVLAMSGANVGGARLFEKQPLVLVASRNASSADVGALAKQVREKVLDTFLIVIEQEVQEM